MCLAVIPAFGFGRNDTELGALHGNVALAGALGCGNAVVGCHAAKGIEGGNTFVEHSTRSLGHCRESGQCSDDGNKYSLHDLTNYQLMIVFLEYLDSPGTLVCKNDANPSGGWHLMMILTRTVGRCPSG